MLESRLIKCDRGPSSRPDQDDPQCNARSERRHARKPGTLFLSQNIIKVSSDVSVRSRHEVKEDHHSLI